MRRAFLAALLLAAGLARAEEQAAGTPPPIPKPGENHKKLDWLVGTWDVAENFAKSEMGPGGAGKGVDTVSWTLGGMWLTSSYSSDGPMGHYEGHGMLTWDENKKTYVSYWFDVFGGHSELAGDWQGDSLVVTSQEYSMEGHKWVERHTYKKVSDKQLDFKVELNQDGKGFATFMESTSKKR